MELLLHSNDHEYDLYLNMIGGHNSFIDVGKGKILKAVDQSEIDFYDLMSDLSSKAKDDSNIKIFPRYFGCLNKQNHPEIIEKVENFLKIYDEVFFFILNNELEKNSNLIKKLNLRKNSIFEDKLQTFLKDNRFYQFAEHCNSDHVSKLKEVEDKIYSLGDEKMTWILFWYITRRSAFLEKEKFIILEDLTYGMKTPAILDLKLGFKPKKHQHCKQLPNSTFEFGLRIMGLQAFSCSKDNLIFKNRHESRMLSNEQLKIEMKNFLTVEGKYLTDLTKSIIIKLEKMIKQLQSINLLDIPAASLLIVYDADYFEKFEYKFENDHKEDKLKIKLIDFTFFQESDTTDNNDTSDVPDNNSIVALENLITLLSSISF